MNPIYRAVYATKAGIVRRMTFSVAGGIKAAYSFAEQWQLADDALQAVAIVRPQFQLQPQKAAA